MPTLRTRLTRRQLLAKVQKLARLLAGKGADPSGAAEGVLKQGAEALLGKIQEAYRIKAQGGTDAMGVSWKKLAKATLQRKQGQGGILLGTGSLLKSLKAGMGISVTSDDPRPGWHQKGAKRLPRRQIVPDPGQPLPPDWSSAIARAVAAGLGEERFWDLYLSAG